MSDQLPMFGPTTSEDTPNVTSSPAEASGRLHSDKQVGQTIDRSGPEAVHVPVSRQQAKVAGLMTLATSGRLGRNSSASESLQLSLENRLMMRLDTAGSTLFKLTWKRKRTPLGRSYLERAVSAGRTSGSGFTSWPTPDMGMNLTDANWEQRRQECKETHGQNGFGLTLGMASTLAGWPSPKASAAGPDFAIAGREASGGIIIATAAALSSWPATATAGGAESGKETTASDVTLASWATPRTEDAESSGMRVSRGVADTLTAQSSLAGWPTPMAGNPGTESYNEAGNTDSSRKTVELCGWRIPSEGDSIRGVHPNPDVKAGTHSLNTEASFAGWTTPQAHDATGRSKTQKEIHGTKHGCACLALDAEKVAISQIEGPARLKASGEIVTGFTADPSEGIPMDAGGQLRAGHSRWLMAIPAAWDGFACMAMQSISKSRKRSSKRISTKKG
jgi:hypothetical protein